MKISNQKQIELEEYLFTNFGLKKIYLHHLEDINDICQKAEKDYVFSDESENGKFIKEDIAEFKNDMADIEKQLMPVRSELQDSKKFESEVITIKWENTGVEEINPLHECQNGCQDCQCKETPF